MSGTIHVCASCQTRDAVRRSAGEAGGAALLAAIAARLRDTPLGPSFDIVPQACLGPCGAGVRLAVTGEGRWGWLFQGLDPAVDLEAFMMFLDSWRHSPDGVLAKAERPPCLLRKTVGRLPPSLATGVPRHGISE